jgi:hypothetical protein
MKKRIKSKEVWDFIQKHPTFWDGIKIPDADVEEHFMMPIDTTRKQQVYTYYRLGLDLLIDKMEEGFPTVDYTMALQLIKVEGFGIPLRVPNWGWEEPETIDELEDHLQKWANRWGRVYDKSLERLNTIATKRKIIKTSLVDE